MDPLDCKLILDALAKLFDDFDARWERRFSDTRAVHEISQVVFAWTQATAVGAAVIADNWGGLFGGDDDSIVVDTDAPVVVDSWGGLFDWDDDYIAAHLSAQLPGSQAEQCPMLVPASLPIERGCEVFGLDTVPPRISASVMTAPATPSPPVTLDRRSCLRSRSRSTSARSRSLGTLQC